MTDAASGPCVMCGTEQKVVDYLWHVPGRQVLQPVSLCSDHWRVVRNDSRRTLLGWCEIHGLGPSDKLCPCGKRYALTP
jgi:hypothetical protein